VRWNELGSAPKRSFRRLVGTGCQASRQGRPDDRRCSAARFRAGSSNLQAIYYRAADGTEPVDEFIDRLNMLTPASPHLPSPHSSQVGGELRELRCHFGRELYRVLYWRSGNLIVLLHAFRKDTGRIPEADIQIAEDRWADFKARMDALKRKPPRAAGHDAP
jgi:phage-related protein